tara:strand:+ start:1143 stop:1313 length:171 start_codon:yes stop_codon:yes gene_type:complete
MKLKTLIENLKFYKEQGSAVVSLDIDELLNALDEIPTTKEVEAKKTIAMDVDSGFF